ncbi:hypothetical protein SEVIR_9G469200v4 [Setaria viridis]|uniref:Uncharacterized protein n=1 Tax=Setaria viridis TaxID=4556 RepID=A0A4U6T5K2_SETVI|nr:hypothetical protein SEVIR_9G469200v2 [Setaria viridis]
MHKIQYSILLCIEKCQNHTFKPLATASFGDMADSSTPIFPRIHVKDPYQRLGISREASEQEIRAARNYLISKYAGHKASVDAIESAHDRIIMQSFFDREKKKPKMDLKKKFRELCQSRAVKAIQGRFQTPHSKVIWQTEITFILLGALTLSFPTEEGPTLQVAISSAANIYFIYQRVRTQKWMVWIFLCFLVPWHLLDGICNSTYTARSCVTYALLFISSTFLK